MAQPSPHILMNRAVFHRTTDISNDKYEVRKNFNPAHSESQSLIVYIAKI